MQNESRGPKPAAVTRKATYSPLLALEPHMKLLPHMPLEPHIKLSDHIVL